MVSNIKKYKDNQNLSYKEVLVKIKNEEKNAKWINYTFPIIHGLNLTKNNEYKFNNIIEAREFLNDKTLNCQTLEICKTLLKLNNLDFLNKKEKQIIKSSLTLFNYITDKNIKSILKFRNYEDKLIEKFTYNKSFTIFKKLLDKFFNGEIDETTTLLIESEIYTYKEKNKILINIKRKDKKLAESILTKYSEISSLVSYNSTLKTTTKRQFYKNLNSNEIKIFKKFNINKKLKQIRDKTEKRIITSLFIIILLSSSLPLQALSNENIIQINKNQTIQKITTVLDQPQEQIINKVKEIKETPTIEQNLITLANSQIGNKGGEIYWRWYGYNYHVDWCAIFISWLAKETGVREEIIPKFAAVSQGVKFYKDRGLWKNRNYIPNPGDIIFFDYNYNGIIDHVGIVEKVENGRIYTIEGNSQDECKEKSYVLKSSSIYGYGTPNY